MSPHDHSCLLGHKATKQTKFLAVLISTLVFQNLLSTGSTEETRPNINKIVYWDVKNQLT